MGKCLVDLGGRVAKKRTSPTSSTKGLSKNPNDFPNAQTPEALAALGVTCLFMGKTFYEGDTICHLSSEWVCTPNGWSKTGNNC
jgi:hypothetical protein